MHLQIKELVIDSVFRGSMEMQLSGFIMFKIPMAILKVSHQKRTRIIGLIQLNCVPVVVLHHCGYWVNANLSD
jgi:hypothetical protein